MLTFAVELDGSVSTMRVTESVPIGYWDNAVIEAVSHWRFRSPDAVTQKTLPLIFELDAVE